MLSQKPGEREKGTWFIMFLTGFATCIIAGWIYNGMVADDTSANKIDGKLPFDQETFYKAAASGKSRVMSY